MNEPTIICPHCKKEIKLTESLAAPLVDATRKEFEQRISKKDEELAAREAQLRSQKEAVEKDKNAIEEKIAERLKLERGKIAEEAKKQAKAVLGEELEQKVKAITDLQEVVKDRNEKLAAAQKEQAELVRKQTELDDKIRAADLAVAKGIQDGLATVRKQARDEAEGDLKLKLSDKEQTIASLAKQLEEMKQRAEQGSQQHQGETLELVLETVLTAKFPADKIEPVPKGQHGGDILQRVVSPSGLNSGTILWESKRTKSWSHKWLEKLRDDQRAAKAEVAVIVSQALPDDVDTFQFIDGVWVTNPKTAVPVAFVLRHSLIELAATHQASEGQQTKMQIMYRYLTGPDFRHRVEAMVETLSSMQEELDKEKRAITAQWAKREKQLERIAEATSGMYGDLQGIAGKTLKEIEGLELKALPSPRKPAKG